MFLSVQFHQCAEEGGVAVAESEEPVVPAAATDEGPAPSYPLAAEAQSHDPTTLPPPHLAQFYPPHYAHSRPPGPEGVAMLAASSGMEPFLPPPPPPLGNPYASPPHWMCPYPPYLQTPSVGVEQSPARYYQERPPNPMPGTTFSTYGATPNNRPAANFGASFDGQEHAVDGGAKLGFGPLQSTQEVTGVFSPPGVTGSSMQVHPPSSPPIDPSVSIQPALLSAGHLKYVAGTTPATATTTTAAAMAGFGASPLTTQVDVMTGGKGAKVSGAEKEEKQGVGEGTKDGGESMSSLPMSVPEGTR